MQWRVVFRQTTLLTSYPLSTIEAARALYVHAHIIILLPTYVRKIRQHKKSTRSPHPALFIGRVFIVVWYTTERPNNKNEAR